MFGEKLFGIQFPIMWFHALKWEIMIWQQFLCKPHLRLNTDIASVFLKIKRLVNKKLRKFTWRSDMELVFSEYQLLLSISGGRVASISNSISQELFVKKEEALSWTRLKQNFEPCWSGVGSLCDVFLFTVFGLSELNLSCGRDVVSKQLQYNIIALSMWGKQKGTLTLNCLSTKNVLMCDVVKVKLWMDGSRTYSCFWARLYSRTSD